MLHTLRSVKDLIAAEAKYDKSCYGSYTSKSNLRFQVPRDKEETKHDEAFDDLISIITPKTEAGIAYDMNSLLNIFKGSLQSKGVDCESYTRQKLKSILVSHFNVGLVFHQPKSTKPELVFSSSVSLLDVVNAASSLPAPDQAKGMQHTRTTLTSHQNDDAEMVYTVATIIRGDIIQFKSTSPKKPILVAAMGRNGGGI